jgi:hypothetical protein
MSDSVLSNHFVYSQNVIEFVTVAAETCLLLEKLPETDKETFVDNFLKVLPLLYLKTTLLKSPESVFDDEPMRFVTEEDYIEIKENIERLLGPDDSYLEVFHPDMPYSDTPVAAFISEDLADIYQELKDFAANYQTADTDVMNDALAVCLNAFSEHWGRKLLNALKALHNIRYVLSVDKNDIQDMDYAQGKNRKSIFGYLDEDENDELSNLIN